DVLSAAGFSVSYQKVDSGRHWDPALHNAVRAYRGEATPDKVRIFARADGLRRRLVEGIIDEKQRSEEGSVSGAFSGRDLMALLLDRRPSESFELEGGEVDFT